MMKGNIKDVFPGGNTYKGFHSFYDYMLPNDEANRIFCIKGGPGVGKSSFMKSVAAKFIDMGCDVERHHCSSDNNSLDGIVIKQAKVAVLDGTNPHVVDPQNPGAVDEILNFGEFWNRDGLKLERDTVQSLNQDIKSLFGSAYHFLACAKELQDDIETLVNQAVDKAGLNELVLNLKSELIDELRSTGRAGRDRHLFQSALTPDGRVDYTDTVITDRFRCYLLKGVHSKGASDILDMLAKEYLMKGYDTEIYHQPLNPERIETILIERLGVAVTVYDSVNDRAFKIIHLDEAVLPDKLHTRNDMIETDRRIMNILLGEAFQRIRAAKQKHDELEKIYIPHMDFEAVGRLEKQIIDRIKSYL